MNKRADFTFARLLGILLLLILLVWIIIWYSGLRGSIYDLLNPFFK